MIGGFLVHLIPNYILIIVTIIAWKKPWIGGLIFVALGIFLPFPLILRIPLLVIGGLFSAQVPHFLKKEPIPEITDKSLQKEIELVKAARTKNEAIEQAMDSVTKKFKSGRFLTYALFWKTWETNPNKLWRRDGFMHCTQENFLVRVILVKSGWVKDEEISYGYGMVWYISPHQYLKIDLDGNKKTALDPWNYYYGAKIGTYASGFGFKRQVRDLELG